VEDDDTSGHQRSHRTDQSFQKVQNLVHSGRHLSIRASVKLNLEEETVKRPRLWSNDWILHHDSASEQKMLSVKHFLAQKLITEMEHPSYSPDLALNDFWMFPEIKPALNEERFQDTKDDQKNVMMALKAIPQQGFQKCFQQWQHSWAKCIVAQREYFEDDPSQWAVSIQVCLQ
jgi:hypothetical protein